MIYAWLLAVALHLQSQDVAPLMAPFEGFSEAEMRPIYALLDADVEGRTLVRNALRKLGVSKRQQLNQIFSFCEASQLGGDRRGLYMYSVDYLYRPRQETKWRELSKGSLAKLANPQQYPVMDSKSWYTTHFEHRKVVFRPQICVARGLNVLETYLVLVHELTHLVGTDPFADMDLLGWDEAQRERDYYFLELGRKGGEVDAYLAQLDAFKRLKQRFSLQAEMGLEQFLSDKGNLLYRDRKAFMRHLLYKVGYDHTLDYALEVTISNTYNVALVWWQYFDERIEVTEAHIEEVEKVRNRYKQLLSRYQDEGGNDANIREKLEEWTLNLGKLRKEVQEFRAERDRRNRLLEQLDTRFPRQ